MEPTPPDGRDKLVVLKPPAVDDHGGRVIQGIEAGAGMAVE